MVLWLFREWETMKEFGLNQWWFKLVGLPMKNAAILMVELNSYVSCINSKSITDRAQSYISANLS